MADNVIMADALGSSYTMATKDISSVHFQKCIFTNDSGVAIPGDATNGLDVDVTRLPALVAGSAIVGKVGIDQTTPGTTNKVSLGSDTVTVSGAVTGTVGVSGSVAVTGTFWQATQPVSGPVTNAELRASSVPVTGPIAPGTAQTWIMQSTFQALATNKIFFDLFNASGSGKVVRVRMICLQKNMAAVTGVAIEFQLLRTTAVGTGGTTLTPVALDTNNTAIPAQITARHAAAGGATSGSLMMTRFYHSEETNVAAQAQEAFPLWPPATLPDIIGQDIVLREGQGLKLTQITASTAGTYNVIVSFTVE
jgi:hypothetical protein